MTSNQDEGIPEGFRRDSGGIPEDSGGVPEIRRDSGVQRNSEGIPEDPGEIPEDSQGCRRDSGGSGGMLTRISEPRVPRGF